MTHDEADALAAAGARAGVSVRVRPCPSVSVHAVEPREPAARSPSAWQVRYWCPDPACCYTVSTAARYRQAVRDGRTELPPGALD